jgi:hypothetical protein
VYLVQAFLLLATWPHTYPQCNNVNEQAWMYVSTATHMAQCLGLHRSFLSSEYTTNEMEMTEDTRREWVRTWVGCFIVSQLYLHIKILLTKYLDVLGRTTHHPRRLYDSKRPISPFAHDLVHI